MKNSLLGYYTYILSNPGRTTLYTGVSNNIERRVLEHKACVGCTFSSRYHTIDLVYFETFPDMRQAIAREKQLKRWHREWKINLIRSENPSMEDLAKDWYTAGEIDEFRTNFLVEHPRG